MLGGWEDGSVFWVNAKSAVLLRGYVIFNRGSLHFIGRHLSIFNPVFLKRNIQIIIMCS